MTPEQAAELEQRILVRARQALPKWRSEVWTRHVVEGVELKGSWPNTALALTVRDFDRDTVQTVEYPLWRPDGRGLVASQIESQVSWIFGWVDEGAYPSGPNDE